MQLRMTLEEQIDQGQGYLFGEFLALDIRQQGAFTRFLEWLTEPIVALDFETVSSVPINSPGHIDSAQVVIAAVAHQAGTAVLYSSTQETVSESDRLWEPFLRELANRAVVVHNAAYDMPIFHRIVGRLPNEIVDTMVLYGVVTPGRTVHMVLRSQSLAAAVMALFQVPMDKSVRESFAAEKFDVVTAEQCRYAAEDVRWTLLLAIALARLCAQHDVMHIAELECRLTPVLLKMQMHGVNVDIDVVRDYSEKIENIISGLENRILDILEKDEYTVVAYDGDRPMTMSELVRSMRAGDGREVLVLDRPFRKGKGRAGRMGSSRPISSAFNIRSHRQVQSYLFTISSGRITTTDSRQLETHAEGLRVGVIANEYPKDYAVHIPDLLDTLVTYRAVTKIQSTYLESWQELARAGRVHTTFVQTYAESGRISSRHPNLQNCPRPDTTQFLVNYTGEPLDMRGMFVAPPGYLLITADYSQYELRVAAERAREHRMIDVYRREYEVRCALEELLWQRYGLHPWEDWEQVQDEQLESLKKQLKDLDFHTMNASIIFGKSPNEVTKQERSQAKSISFGVLYGMQARSLAETIRRMTGTPISETEAQRLLDTYFRTYKNLHLYIQRTAFDARKNGYVLSMYGRKRWCVFPRFNTDVGLRRLLSISAGALEREAINHTIQATNADATKWALVLLDERLRGYDAYPVLTVHDEIVVQACAGQVNEVARILKDCMVEGSKVAGMKEVPTVVEVSIGPTWKK